MSTVFLIADDVPGKQHYMKALLKRAQFPAEVLMASNTDEAIRIAGERPDIGYAFVDYRMPTATGVPVIRAIRDRHPSARIALITASEGERPKAEARDAGADAAISTAYPESFVTEKILKLLEEWKRTR